MAPPARQRILDVATPLFLRHGFHAIGLDRILADAQLTKTTFYNHFDSKDDLIIEVIHARDEVENQQWLQQIPARAGDAPRQQLEVIFDIMTEWFCDEDFLGCIFLTAAFEFPNPHDPVHQAAARHYHAFAGLVRRSAHSLGVVDADGFTAEYLVIIMGVIAMRMSLDNPDAAIIGRRLADQLLDRYTGAAAPAD